MSAQSPAPWHPVHSLAAQRGAVGSVHSALPTHSTQAPVAVSHSAVSGKWAHCALSSQPEHSPVSSQTGIAAEQSFSLRHATHSPSGRQRGVLGKTLQSASAMHATHAPLLLHSGVAPSQSVSLSHSTHFAVSLPAPTQ